MLCLGLEGQPASELIPGTAQIWCDRLSHINPHRLRVAFDIVEERAQRWPTPASIIEALPIYEHTYLPAPEGKQIPVDPEYRTRADVRIRAEIERCAAMLSLKEKANDEG